MNMLPDEIIRTIGISCVAILVCLIVIAVAILF